MLHTYTETSMPKPLSEFARFCIDILSPYGDITIRSMMGGYALYNHRIIFATIARETLYFKVDETTIPHFKKAGCMPFVYEKNGKKYEMKYYTVPHEALESPTQLQVFFDLAWEVAQKARKKA